MVTSVFAVLLACVISQPAHASIFATGYPTGSYQKQHEGTADIFHVSHLVRTAHDHKVVVVSPLTLSSILPRLSVPLRRRAKVSTS